MKDLDEAEWNFAQVPDDQVKACVLYELAREVVNWKDFFDPKANLDLLPRSLRERALRRTRYLLPATDDPSNFILSSYFWPKYFPESPWMLIPRVEASLIATRFPQSDGGIMGWEKGTYDAEVIKTSPLYEVLKNGMQTVPLTINWTHSDAGIADDFRLWLTENRPAGVRIKTERGRQSLRDDLNAISALRLRHHYLADEARRVTKRVHGKPLYSEKPSWDRAANRAVLLFRQVYTNAVGPKSILRKTAQRGRPKKN